MGILDPKERVIDAIITEEGRSQLSVGEMDFSFATFTDLGTFYDGVEGGVALEASGRPMFEAYARKTDTIVPIADDAGRTFQFQSGDLKMFNTTVLSGTSAELDTAAATPFEGYLLSSVDNFAQNYVIGEIDEFADENEFRITADGSSDDFSQKYLEMVGENQSRDGVSVTNFPCIFEDPDFQRTLNYAFLPPNNESGNALSEDRRFSFAFSEVGRTSSKSRSTAGFEAKHFTVESKSSTPDMLFQVFERRFADVAGEGSGFRKLLVVDVSDESESTKYLVGKVFSDDLGRDTFLNIFTVIFE